MVKKILIVFGTRPEAIKMAPIVHELQKHPEIFKVVTCVSAQHRQMLDQVLALFSISPDYDLDLMRPGQDLFDVTSGVLLGMRGVLDKEQPDACLVHGDTTTSMAAALAAFYREIPVGHVEAGLRTYDLTAPFPEELNRQMTGRMARFHFAPTTTSRDNLLREGVTMDSILVTGNTVIDALFAVVSRIDKEPLYATQLKAAVESKGYRFSQNRMILVTGHRRENFGEGFQNICHALRAIALARPEVDIVYPVHLNPNVRRPVAELLTRIPNVHLIEPLDYAEFILLMKHAYIILTDSGGIQEEAPSLGKPVLVMRETTERPEAVEAGTAILVGTNINTIVSNVSMLLDNDKRYQKMSEATNPYGDGTAAKLVCLFLAENLTF